MSSNAEREAESKGKEERSDQGIVVKAFLTATK